MASSRATLLVLSSDLLSDSLVFTKTKTKNVLTNRSRRVAQLEAGRKLVKTPSGCATRPFIPVEKTDAFTLWRDDSLRVACGDRKLLRYFWDLDSARLKRWAPLQA